MDPIPTPFQAPWWCRNRHLQTVWGPLFRPGPGPLTRQRHWTRDGDFVDLDWTAGASGTPLLLVLHGLEGSSRSHYAAGLVREAAARGWRAVILNFRSCGGEMNRLPRFYHSGDTGDLDEVVQALAAGDATLRLGLVGVSLGGNVLLKWLEERHRELPPAVVGAVAISTPFALAASARALERGVSRLLYTRRFLRSLRRKVRDKAVRHPGFVDLQAVDRARTFAEYDRAVTAPLHGFADEHDYWARASSGPGLARIRCATLLINAADDPMVPAESLPAASALPPAVRSAFQLRGGHAGFLEGPWPWRSRSWAERAALEFLSARLGARERL